MVQLEGEAAKMMVSGMMSGMAGNKSEVRRTNLKCPECDGDIVDTEGGVIQLFPARKRVACKACEYKGWRMYEETDDGYKSTEEIISKKDFEDQRIANL